MNYQESNEYFIRKSRPTVLLIGNGVLRSCEQKSSKGECVPSDWGESIYRIARRLHSNDERERLKDIPYSILSTAITDTEDKNRRGKYKQNFQTLEFENDEILRGLSMLKADAILTTNYTYEIENIFNTTYSEIKAKSRYAYTTRLNSDGTRDVRLLRTYNQVEGSPPIWHIHGELRNPSSMVLTHDEYSKLICDIVNYNRENGNRYDDYDDSLKFKSWIDYFIMGNVFIIGQGLDFSEFDLWWLLNRRQRERAKCGCGQMYYFTPKNKSEKVQLMLEYLGVKVIHFDMEISKENCVEDFKKFYRRAMKVIEEMIEGLNRESVE